LRRLGTDRIDLYKQHQPAPTTPVEEILEALDSPVRAGKVREIGCCNFSGQMLDKFRATSDRSAWVRFRTWQVLYSLLERPGPEVIEGIVGAGMLLLAYFPLASGLLTGKYRRDELPPPNSRLGADGLVSRMLRDGLMARRPPLSPERLDTIKALSDFAAQRGHSLLELAVSWLASHPIVAAVLTGATTPDQITANACASASELTEEDLGILDKILALEGVTPEP
jgi:aryl-alcohol dehydrogenase-like predicted oxidoreductase